MGEKQQKRLDGTKRTLESVNQAHIAGLLNNRLKYELANGICENSTDFLEKYSDVIEKLGSNWKFGDEGWQIKPAI